MNVILKIPIPSITITTVITISAIIDYDKNNVNILILHNNNVRRDLPDAAAPYHGPLRHIVAIMLRRCDHYPEISPSPLALSAFLQK